MARVCLARGHVGVAASDVDAGGRFAISVRVPAGPLLLLVLADGRDAVRRHLVAEEPELVVDSGRLVLVPVERPAGVYGILWDEAAQAPLGGGVITLSTGDRTVAGPFRADPDGTFTIRMTCERPLPSGDYRLEVPTMGVRMPEFTPPFAGWFRTVPGDKLNFLVSRSHAGTGFCRTCRAVHRTRRWRPNELPNMRQRFAES